VKTGTSEAGYTQVTFLENMLPAVKIVTKGTYFLISEKINPSVIGVKQGI